MRNIVALSHILAATLFLFLTITGTAQTAALEETPVEWRITEKEVAAVQTELKRRGYYNSTPSGILDRSTRESVRSYQTDNGLKVNGRIDRTTYEALKLPYPATGDEQDSERRSGILPSIGYGIKDRVVATGQTLEGAATKVKVKTGDGYDKAKETGGEAVTKTKEVGEEMGSMTVRGVRAIGRGAQRAGDMIVGRSDADIQTDVRELLKSDSETEKWYTEVKSGMVTIKTPQQHNANVGTVVSDLRKIAGVKSVFVIAE
jgi:peptidoglycan hydrolase-like protein with peptidoglycan-binding domain